MVPKLLSLGGSSGKAGCTAPHRLRPVSLTGQRFQNVHRDIGGALGIPEVSASRKNIWSTGLLLTAPARRTRKIRRQAPAIRTREPSAKSGPRGVSWGVHGLRHMKCTWSHIVGV